MIDTLDRTNIEEQIQQFWESPEGFFDPSPWTPQLPMATPHPSAGVADAPAEIIIFSIIFSLYLGAMIFYPIGNIIIIAITKRTMHYIIASLGPAIMAAGWLVSLNPDLEYSLLITVCGLLLCLVCVLHEIIRRQKAIEQDQEAKPDKLITTLRPIIIIGVGILLWELQQWIFAFIA